ncbi:tetratricopeptide repeat protein [Cystobacter fuscus]
MLLTSLAWGETSNSYLPRARLLLEELRYTEAARALEQARAQPGNDRDTLLEILEMQGVVAGMLQQPAKARAAFQTLLVLAPDYRLKGDYAPRVVTPFFEAKGWVSDKGAALRLEALPTSGADNLLTVQVKPDVLNLGRSVRFHLREAGAGWREQEQPLTEGKASVEKKGTRVEWWAELLDERRAVLTSLGSDTSPLGAPAPGAIAATPAPLPAPVSPLPGKQPQVARAPGLPLRTLAYVSLGLAVGAGAAGGYLGVQSNQARARVVGAPVDEAGLTVGLTQREAFALDARARSQAQWANILFGVAGAAAIAGGTLWVLGAPVSVSATPAGVVVGGVFP